MWDDHLTLYPIYQSEVRTMRFKYSSAVRTIHSNIQECSAHHMF